MKQPATTYREDRDISIELVIKKSSDNEFEEWLYAGSVELDAAFDWVGEIFAVTGVVERLDSGPATFRSSVLMAPASNRLLRFTPTKIPASGYEYQFTADDLDLLE